MCRHHFRRVYICAYGDVKTNEPEPLSMIENIQKILHIVLNLVAIKIRMAPYVHTPCESGTRKLKKKNHLGKFDVPWIANE